VDPPSVVTISSAAVILFGLDIAFGPTATHVVELGHVTDQSEPVPPLTTPSVQVSPPLVLTRTWSPTATQNVELGHETALNAATFDGSVGTLQVAPLLVERRICPTRGVSKPGETPTAIHVVADAQLTPRSVVFAVGIVADDHEVPPFDE
jgi:hypothetical protein